VVLTRGEKAQAAAGVQSLDRAFQLLEHLADAGGESRLSELSAASGLPLPTIHRLMRSLVNRGYVRQEPSRLYTLGPRLIRLGESASRMLATWARPHLAELVEATGESANLAMRDGDEVVYVAQAPSRHAVRMFTEVGRRLPMHSTGVGKALLAQLPSEEVRAIVARTGLPGATPNTITDLDALLAALERTREQGYALDEGEQEVGVSCIAVGVPDAPTLAAISVSGPAGRLPAQDRERIVTLMKSTAAELASALTYHQSTA
jgi:IclR family transcriptional regulator, acetate operon repressor